MRFDLTFTKKAPTSHPFPGPVGVAANAIPKKTLKTMDARNSNGERPP